MAAKTDPKQTLSKKDEAQLRQAMKLFESKQSKKALKTVETILKTNPDHGESLAMKGLIVGSPPISKTEEAHALVMQGVSKNFSSVLCWHVYGLLHKQEQNYVEAIKCYKQALRHESDNMAILRDLSVLQVHSRELDSLAETRQKLLELKPNNKANWLNFALAHHLQGNYQCALVILDAYEKTMGLPSERYDCSEFLLYRIQVVMEAGDHKEALALLEKLGAKLTDREAVLSMKGECLEKLGEWGKAADCYLELVDSNVEADNFIDAYLEAREQADKGYARGKEIAALREKYPKSQTLEHLELQCASGARSEEILKEFLARFILNGIPSLSSAMKTLYGNPERAALIGKIIAGFEAEYAKGETVNGKEASRAAQFWLLFAQACHSYRSGEYKAALEWIEKAIAHTPTIEVSYHMQAKMHRKLGDTAKAVESMQTARKLDLADRFYGNKTCKYLMRNGEWQESEKLFSLFTYKKPHETWTNIIDMQVMWYVLEAADCFYRKGDVLAALERYVTIDKMVQDIHEDQHDFHSYATKKMFLRAYLDMLRSTDEFQSHPRVCRAAKAVVRCYLDINKLGLEEAEKRRLPELAAHEEERAKLLTKEQKEKEVEGTPKPDLKNPLAAAERFMNQLLKHRGSDMEVQLLAIELATESKKTAKGLRILKQAMNLEGAKSCSELKTKGAAFFASQAKLELHPVLKELVGEVEAEFKKL